MDGQDFAQIRVRKSESKRKELKEPTKKDREWAKFLLLVLIIVISVLGIYFLYSNYLSNSRNLVWPLPSTL